MLLPFLSIFAIVVAVLGTSIPIPDNDPFYHPPAGFESSTPGTILNNRTLPSPIPSVSAAQVLYRTMYANGTATATVATIFFSPTGPSSKLVSYAEPEDAANTTCAPSYLFSTNTTSSSQTLLQAVQAGVGYGWTVVVPDHEGLNSAYAVGRQLGYAVLDGLRAALNYAPALVEGDAKLGGFGYSGGTIATGWAASLQKNYAPELNVVGWTFGGTPANLTAALQNLEGGLYGGFVVAGFASIIAAYPTAEARFAEIGTPIGLAAIQKAYTQCNTADLEDSLLANVETIVYQSLGSRLLYDPVFASIFMNATMGLNADETPVAPVYMYHSITDEIVPYAPALKAANTWCTNGASVEFVTETAGTGHIGTYDVLLKNSTDWLDLRLGGTPPPAACSNVSFFEIGSPLRK